MKKILLLAVVALIMTSCTEMTKEQQIKDAFTDYVESDFPDPEDFERVTSINIVDTISSERYIKFTESEAFKNVFSIVATESQKRRLNNILVKLKKEKTMWVVSVLKVRLNDHGDKSIKEYFAIDKQDEGKIIRQDHDITSDEAPRQIKEMVFLIKEITYNCSKMGF